jgi:hypothetical protein
MNKKINNDYYRTINEAREELIEKHIEDIDIGYVLDSAMDGAIAEIERQLKQNDCPDDIFRTVQDEVFTNRIIIDKE